MGDADVLLVGGTVTSTAGGPLAGAVVDVWQTGPTAATTSGTSASRR